MKITRVPYLRLIEAGNYFQKKTILYGVMREK